MAIIQEEILDEFCRKLAETEGFTDTKVKKLHDLFSVGKKPKAADVIRVLSEPLKEDLP
jgi:hypothetical protein